MNGSFGRTIREPKWPSARPSDWNGAGSATGPDLIGQPARLSLEHVPPPSCVDLPCAGSRVRVRWKTGCQTSFAAPCPSRRSGYAKPCGASLHTAYSGRKSTWPSRSAGSEHSTATASSSIAKRMARSFGTMITPVICSSDATRANANRGIVLTSCVTSVDLARLPTPGRRGRSCPARPPPGRAGSRDRAQPDAGQRMMRWLRFSSAASRNIAGPRLRAERTRRGEPATGL